MTKERPENPNRDIFTTFERLEITHRVEVREDNLDAIARHFGWRVAYDFDEPRLMKPTNGWETIEIGAWVDSRGSLWTPEPLTQGWMPEGTYSTDLSEACGDGEHECCGFVTCPCTCHEPTEQEQKR